MTNAQKPNKGARNKSNHKTTTAGKRAKKRLRHGVSKDSLKNRRNKK